MYITNYTYRDNILVYKYRHRLLVELVVDDRLPDNLTL